MLPENVMFDILSRLPVKTIVTCKCVCKRWRALVEDPYFVHLHLSRSREEAVMVLEFSGIHHGTLKWLEIEHEHLDTVKNIWFGGFLLYPFGSVNGLVFGSSMQDPRYIFNILNPVLEEYMALPPLPPPHQGSLMKFGYGFGVSTAGEYKVVNISINLSETAVGIQVHTLGTDGWRSLRQTPPNLGWLEGAGVYLNSHLYWLADHGQIYDFDLSTETSELFPYPLAAPADNQEPHRMLGVVKGRLSCICWSSSGGGVEVWVRKEESAKWYKEITLVIPFIELEPRPLCLIDSVEGTSVLLVSLREGGKLVAYCLNTNKILNETPFSWSNSLSMITYRPSFVKLGNFESERVHVMYNHNRQGLKKI